MESADLIRHDAVEIANLRKELEAAKSLLHEHLANVEHRQQIFEKAARRARIGVFECSLPDERLEWSEVVYELFDIPFATVPDRRICLECYTPASIAELNRRRTKAIEDRGSFSLDAEIVTPKGSRRWIRIGAQVECEANRPVRLFGIKQDITEEKILFDRTRYLAEFDAMTDLANRGRFQMALSDGARTAAGTQPLGALLLIDLDGFKAINDTYGHAAGDVCLTEAARRIRAVSRDADLVARIGGDEFAVMLGSGTDHEAAASAAERIIERINRPYEFGDVTVRLGASIGIALAGDCDESDFYMKADIALYTAKATGRNTYRIYEPALETSQRSALPSFRDRNAQPADIRSNAG